jgi:hypothetical protein
MGPWPKLLESPTITVLEEEKRGDILQQHLRIEIAPGRHTEDCYRLIPPGEGPFPAVVVVFYDAKTGVGLGKPMRDFAWQLAQRGYVALSLGSNPETYYPNKEECQLQPLSFHAYEAANCCTALQKMKQVDPKRVGIVGHSYGGKWAMFASALHEEFACAAWSDPGIVFDEKRGNVNYWEPWYIGFDPQNPRTKTWAIPTKDNPAHGPYKKLREEGHDLHELHALLAPRPFLVSGGAEDQPERWIPLNHSIAVNKLLGVEHRVAMTNRKAHDPSEESNRQMCEWFDYWLKK